MISHIEIVKQVLSHGKTINNTISEYSTYIILQCIQDLETKVYAYPDIFW